jgi:excinuclease ABC subunit A
MIRTLERLRDLGNTVIVVEHDEETIRAADWLVEIGPGPGIHGGEVVAQGPSSKVLADPKSLTGAFLRGEKQIPTPEKRRAAGQRRLRIRGARHNNLQNLEVEIPLPLGLLVCVTGASGSGKSSLVHEIIFKKLASLRYDSRILAGAHDAFEGHEAIDDVMRSIRKPLGVGWRHSCGFARASEQPHAAGPGRPRCALATRQRSPAGASCIRELSPDG